TNENDGAQKREPVFGIYSHRRHRKRAPFCGACKEPKIKKNQNVYFVSARLAGSTKLSVFSLLMSSYLLIF
ncbi:MAG: hypothetical protein ACK54M_14730, partial [Pseudanabaena sp.]